MPKRDRSSEKTTETAIIGEDQDEDEDEDEDEEEKADPETVARSYQLEALEMAREQNTIVYLETGSGKTLIAVMLLRCYAHLLRKPRPSVGVFLVPTVVLVTQQADVVERHTDLKVARFWGEMGVDSWDAATWSEKMRQSEVFVMTPQILLDCLSKTFIKLEHIKLLIFDECHNARGRSPYASIMTHFYHRQLKLNPCAELPRIFGMTASPIVSKGCNYSKQITELETLMNSKVFTVCSESVIAKYIPFSTPRIKFYDASLISSNLFNILENNLTKLKLKHLSNLDSQMLDSHMFESAKSKIKRHYDTLLYCLDELGPWLATKAAEALSRSEKYMLFWGEIKDKYGEKAGRMFSQAVYDNFSQYVSKDINIGKDFEPDIKTGLLTSKVQCLIKCLKEYKDLKGLRCIVFVERIITATVLKSLLINIKKLTNWGVEFMAGNNLKNIDTQSRNEQNKIIESFHKGEVNIIVATQILEEGLDVPSCNLVIRFDPSCTVSSFIQSKGRARMPDSDYLILLRKGDELMQRKVRKFLKSGDEMREESIKLSSIPCGPLKNEISEEEFYLVEKTGAIVTLSSSVSLVYTYCSKLPSDRYFKSTPRFVINEAAGTGVLHLPKSSPVQTAQANGKNKRDSIKRLVCLEACRILHENGALNDYLLPQSYSDDDSDDDCLDGMEEYNEEQPDYFPGVLLDCWNDFISLGIYYCYKISFKNKENSGKIGVLEDVILVLRSDLGPDFSSYSFNLETDNGILSVSLEFIGKNHFSRNEVKMARRFQISVFSILIDRDFSTLNEKMQHLFMSENNIKSSSNKQVVYLLLPCKNGRVDWSTIMQNSSSSEKSVQTKNGSFSIEMIENSVVYTPHSDDFYCITGIHNHLNFNSSFQLRIGEFISYKNYYKSRHDIDLTCDTTPLLSARHIIKVQNFLTKRIFKKEKGNKTRGCVELPPELCRIIMCPLSINTLNSFIYLPTIMHRIQCILLASILKLQLAQCLQNINIPTIKILEAITDKKCHEEHSLESLETFGDSFLKYAASNHLFFKYKQHHEGILSPKKERLVSNSFLCRLACLQNLPGYLRTEEFNPKQWAIPCLYQDTNTYTISSIKEAYTHQTRRIKLKRIADLTEALIGACLSEAGEPAAFRFLENIGTGIGSPEAEAGIKIPVLESPERFVNVRELERLLGYEFGEKSLLVEAMTHGSYQVPDVPRSYQRLEFLGDAILDHLITIHLYSKYYPTLTPGLLTDLRSASVNNDCYAHAAAKAGLNKHVLHASSELHRHISTYLESFGSGEFEGSSFGWDAGLALPKVLGDVIESLAGAIYIDSNCNKEVVWQSIKPLLEPIVTPETLELHPVRELEELCAREGWNKSYELTNVEGQACVRVIVEADCEVYTETKNGVNKKTAQKMAAKAVLLRLEEKMR
ncbi:hypothetical protein LUZ60_007854 [Juncus effusus]|nr:hypothetical protein LUZ60_007854 [Juncus effusus]